MSHICRCHALRLPAQVVVHAATVARRQTVRKARFPRFHIGESLLASINDVLVAIGADGLVRQAGFPQKWGAPFMTAGGGGGTLPRLFCRARRTSSADLAGPPAAFDELLLRHPAAFGFPASAPWRQPTAFVPQAARAYESIRKIAWPSENSIANLVKPCGGCEPPRVVTIAQPICVSSSQEWYLAPSCN